MKKAVSIMLIILLLLSFTAAAPKNFTGFTDVPKGHFFEEAINKLQELNITQGIGNGQFGFNKEISRAEFLAFLVKLQAVELNSEMNQDMFLDVGNAWYYPFINTGMKQGIIIKSDYADNKFLPLEPITREEMAVMIVRAMGYDNLASGIGKLPSQFKDVYNRAGYIELAKDLEIIYGRNKEIFDPSAKATRQEAAAMLVRMYNKFNAKLDTLHGFYAIKSFEQVNKISLLDSVAYGWSRLDYNQSTQQIELTTQKNSGGHPFYLPEDYQLALNNLNTGLASKYLMVFGSNEDTVAVNGESKRLVSLLLSSEAAMDKLVTDINTALNSFVDENGVPQLNGVVIDFEGLRDNGTDKQSFVQLLTKLDGVLQASGKKLMVCVNPPREAGQPYYNGYDFAEIGRLADYVVLMAHDYDTKKLSAAEAQYFKGETPLAPIKDVYLAMKYAMNNGAGVPKDKLLLQISFGTAQWQFKNGAVVNTTPYNPDYGKLIGRMRDLNTITKELKFSELYQAPYMIYEAEGISNMIWYEDERSVAAKARLAKLLGIEGLSFWRLGLIPDYSAVEDDAYNLDVWKVIKELNQ